MSGTREPVPAILWHEGMMLAPQHFQQLSLRQEQVTLYHVAAASPYHWGVANLLLDRVALVGGIVRVLEIEAILPDGLIVHHVADRDPALEIDITEHADSALRTPVTVHLAVPAGRSVDGAGAELARYNAIEGVPTSDDAGGAEEITIQRLQPRLSLVTTTAPGQRVPAKLVAMPIARVSYENEAFALASYVPPTIGVAEQSTLGRLVADIARRAREKALYLAGKAAAAQANGQPVLPETRAEIQGLASGLPALEVLIASGQAHPFALYLELARYAGLVSTFASATVPPVLPRYDHDNPLPAFSEIRDVVARTLARVKQSYAPVPFNADGQKFTLAMEPGWVTGRMLIGVRGPVGMSDAEIAAWVEGCLIASRDKSQQLWDMRVSGAARAPLESTADLDFVPPRGTVMFAIEGDPAAITPNEVLEIWNADARPGRLRPTEIVLYVAT
jgi:type VI secretion system protein ImpJ